VTEALVLRRRVERRGVVVASGQVPVWFLDLRGARQLVVRGWRVLFLEQLWLASDLMNNLLTLLL